MNNFIVTFVVYANLILVAGKVWNKLDWSWFYILMPFTILFIFSAISHLAGRRSFNRMRKSSNQALDLLIDMVRKRRAEIENELQEHDGTLN